MPQAWHRRVTLQTWPLPTIQANTLAQMQLHVTHDPNNEGKFHVHACKMHVTQASSTSCMQRPCHVCNIHAMYATIMTCMQHSCQACLSQSCHAWRVHAMYATVMPCMQSLASFISNMPMPFCACKLGSHHACVRHKSKEHSL